MKPPTIIHRDQDRQQGHWGEELADSLAVAEKLSRRKAMIGLASALGAYLLLRPTRVVAAVAAGLANEPNAAVKTGQFIFPRLQFNNNMATGKHWNISPMGDVILRQKLRTLTNVNVSDDPKIVRLSAMDEMCRFPFVFMTSGGSFELPDDELQNLKEFLTRGGFVFADDCMFEGSGDKDRFFQSYRQHIGKIFPDNPMREIPLDHEVFHSYFDFTTGSPHMQGTRFATSNAAGLFEPGTGRIMTYICPGDLHCGWVCRFWAEEKNMEAIKMGINVLIYYLTH